MNQIQKEIIPNDCEAKYIMNESFFKEYLLDSIVCKNKKIQKLVRRTLYTDCESYDLMYYVESSEGDVSYRYNETWYLSNAIEITDINYYCIKIVINGINSSSGYAMCRCGMDDEYSEDSEQEN